MVILLFQYRILLLIVLFRSDSGSAPESGKNAQPSPTNLKVPSIHVTDHPDTEVVQQPSEPDVKTKPKVDSKDFTKDSEEDKLRNVYKYQQELEYGSIFAGPKNFFSSMGNAQEPPFTESWYIGDWVVMPDKDDHKYKLWSVENISGSQITLRHCTVQKDSNYEQWLCGPEKKKVDIDGDSQSLSLYQERPHVDEAERNYLYMVNDPVEIFFFRHVVARCCHCRQWSMVLSSSSR